MKNLQILIVMIVMLFFIFTAFTFKAEVTEIPSIPGDKVEIPEDVQSIIDNSCFGCGESPS